MKKPITLVRAALVAAVCSLSVHADKVYYVEPDGNNPEGMTVDAVLYQDWDSYKQCDG